MAGQTARARRGIRLASKLHCEPPMRWARGERGFTLVEVLIATVVLSTAVVATAGLFGIAGLSVRNARRQSVATLMAAGKLAELRVSDVALSPPDALVRDTPGCVDYLDASGRAIAGGSQRPPEAVFVRRWRVQPLPDDPVDSLIIEVLVVPGDARVIALRTREAVS
jgi:prepilin-type N-terminal cleavage/methylation domain-containing protein